MSANSRSVVSEWPGYAATLQRAQSESGVDESVSVAVEPLGHGTAVVARSHFGFMGGSMGIEHGARVVAGIKLAIRRRLPFVAVVASGGARSQEGASALLQMRATVEAVVDARRAGVPVIAVLTHPTMGGVHASYASAADVIIAEQGSTVGFAGPRVVEALTGRALPAGSHTAEGYWKAGLVDELVPVGHGLSAAARWVSLLTPDTTARSRADRRPAVKTAGRNSPRGWDAVVAARSAERPTLDTVLNGVFGDVARLGGDRTGQRDPVIVTGLARVGGNPVIVIGTDRHAPALTPDAPTGAPGPFAYRSARRAVQIAQRWRLPIITLIDLPGADPTADSDRGGLVNAIAELTAELAGARTRRTAVVIGEGSSGGALCLAVADRVLMQEDAVLDVIAPEGAAAIVLRDPGAAARVAEHMGLDAVSLLRAGHIDRILPGPTVVGVSASLDALRDALERELTSEVTEECA